MNIRIDQLIDAHNGVINAIDDRKRVILRRSEEGKTSPRAVEELLALLALPIGYQTPAQKQRGENEQQCSPRD